MLYLFDADTLIKAHNRYFRPKMIPPFWHWLVDMANSNTVKIPLEQYEEIIAGNDDLVEWLKDDDVNGALLFEEAADPAIVDEVVSNGYGDLDDTGIEKVGRDPFLISYGYADPANRTIVTFEASSPRRQGANRKIPDVCNDLGVPWCDLFAVVETLDFTIDWKPY